MTDIAFLHAEVSDISVRTLCEAFSKDEVGVAIVPDDELRGRLSVPFFEDVLESRANTTIAMEWWKAVLVYSENSLQEEGWIPPDVSYANEIERKLAEAFGNIWKKFDQIRSDRQESGERENRFLSLDYIGVSDELRGKGIGKELLEQFARIAEEKNLSAYLYTTNPQNVPYYQKHGYELLSSYVEPVTWVRVYFFERIRLESPVLVKLVKKVAAGVFNERAGARENELRFP